MRIYKVLIYLPLLVIMLPSCDFLIGTTVDEELKDFDLNKAKFSELQSCDQVRIYAEIGGRHLDFDHKVAILPYWVIDSIANRNLEAVSSCIQQEGDRLLQTIVDSTSSRNAISDSIHALFYLADDLNLYYYQETRDFMNKVVCENDIRFSYTLARIYYIQEFGTVPEYHKEKDAEQRMKAELCADR